MRGTSNEFWSGETEEGGGIDRKSREGDSRQKSEEGCRIRKNQNNLLIIFINELEMTTSAYIRPTLLRGTSISNDVGALLSQRREQTVLYFALESLSV